MSDDNFDEFTFDAEPEDAWDASDTVLEQIANLFLRLDALEQVRNHPGRYRPLLEEIDQRMRRWRSVSLNEREQLRLRQLEEDLAFVRSRDERGDYERGE